MITHSSCPTAAQYHYKGDFTMNENTNVQIITLFPLADSMPPQLINNVSVTAKICREQHLPTSAAGGIRKVPTRLKR